MNAPKLSTEDIQSRCAMQVGSLQSQLLRLKQDIAEQKRFIQELGRTKRYHGCLRHGIDQTNWNVSAKRYEAGSINDPEEQRFELATPGGLCAVNKLQTAMW